MSKLNYWDPVYEDSMNLIAQLPGVAALIYRNTYKGGELIPRDPKLDWAANLSHQMGARFVRCPAQLRRASNRLTHRRLLVVYQYSA